jgi:hypothetical protein
VPTEYFELITEDLTSQEAEATPSITEVEGSEKLKN